MAHLNMTVGQALSEVPVNIFPLKDSSDYSTETTIAYNASGMTLVWNFIDSNGNWTRTSVTPTSGGVHDWTHQGQGYYSLEIPASGGTINNNAVGIGWFTGQVTGVLDFRGPYITFGVPAVIVGTFSGSHTSTTSDLGANAPSFDVSGWTLFAPADGVRVVSSYATGTGVATHAAWGSAVTNGEPWMLFPTAVDAAGVRAAVGLASANLDTQLSTIDTVVDGVKTKTDQLTFTSGAVQADLQKINTVDVTGDGGSGTEFSV